jgi:flavin reductase (DIM6/NTAB) family NADH-FMN oxidoreductase RutF
MIIDADDLDVEHAYKLLIATIVPRPIGWISTLSSEGVANLAPLSFFTVVGQKPPILSLTMQHRPNGALKDSFVNIRDTGEFVTNLVTLGVAGAMHKSATEFAPEVDEFERVGLEKAPCEVVRPPRVALAPVAMECKLKRCFTVGDYEDHVVWGRVARFHIRDDLLSRSWSCRHRGGRLAAEYRLVNNVFTTLLDRETIHAWSNRRIVRLDGKPADFSAVGQKNWSASGSVMDD